MNKKDNKGFVATDMVLAILAIMIFSILIVSLMYNTALENLKIKVEALATIYLTEILENVGIAQYDDITQEKIDKGETILTPENITDNFRISIIVEEDLELTETQKTVDIIKKVTATISYKVGNKDYELSMGRTKIKE